MGGPDNPSPDVAISNLDAGGGVAKLTFGDPAGFGTGPNYFTFDGAGSDPDNVPPAFANVPAGSLFDLGHFQYFNGTTSLGTNLDAASLGISLHLSSPADAAPPTSNYLYNFAIDITPNTTGNPVLDGDIVTIGNGVTTSTFTSGGLTYTLALKGFSSDGGATYKTSFLAPEDTLASADIYAVIDQPANISTPEPAGLALLAAGLASLGAVRRRSLR